MSYSRVRAIRQCVTVQRRRDGYSATSVSTTDDDQVEILWCPSLGAVAG